MAADPQLELDERLREACSIGDAESVRRLLDRGARVNGRNPVNGWTSLHWASKRGHHQIVSLLLETGAQTNVLTSKGESAAQLATRPELTTLLGVDEDHRPAANGHEELPIIPHYLANPPLPVSEADPARGPGQGPGPAGLFANTGQGSVPGPAPHLLPPPPALGHSQLFWMGALPDSERELVLKVRLHSTGTEADFIEVELDRGCLTYQALLSLASHELGVSPEQVERIRKLPNTLLRKDKDVRRLQHFQELELVLRGAEGEALVQAGLTERPCYNPGAATLIY
ncbi:ankyrin repeat domain-containing protein 40 [Leucoraja erinacea]|uniref:ankyrin repeat domain-containing protein 40 n=1 Tax=Leucoraja erinaceus TaxID=7782 RepID=UPI0024539E47|nr:ankyrin repeat domain-containing protein 40 [Leucoraja erinacea]